MNSRPHGSPFGSRRSIRLPEYDYSQPGAYYVTLCTRKKALLFGEIRAGGMILNSYGQVVEQEWRRSAEVRSEIRLDAYVIMPNHMHAVIFIAGQAVLSPMSYVGATGWSPSSGGGLCMGDQPVAPTREKRGGPGRKSLAALVGGFKTSATKRINRIRDTRGLPVWQRNYYERVIRDEQELNRIRQYISDNPIRWNYDIDNPEAPLETDADPWT